MGVCKRLGFVQRRSGLRQHGYRDRRQRRRGIHRDDDHDGLLFGGDDRRFGRRGDVQRPVLDRSGVSGRVSRAQHGPVLLRRRNQRVFRDA